MMAFFVYPLWIFFARTLDRLGKGIRTGARDALLSDECTPQNKGKVFGFHRGFDTLGAVFGPAIALVYLYFHPADYKGILLWAFVPGIVAISFTFFIKEKKKAKAKDNLPKVNFFAIFSYWKQSTAEYKKLVTGLLLFALFNSSDVFLLLKLKANGLNDTYVVGAYIFYNISYALLSYPAGILADRLGMKKILLSGLLVFAIVYAGFAINSNPVIFFALFLLYGFYAAATEGVSKAWISNMVSRSETATAIGTFTGLQSICLLVASTLTGFLWVQFGAAVTFSITAGVTILVILYLSGFRKPTPDLENKKI